MGKLLTSYDLIDKVITFTIIGKFDHKCIETFRQVYENSNGIKSFFIDMSQVTYLDTDGIDALLLMCDTVTQQYPEVVINIINSDGHMQSIFDCVELDNINPELLIG